LEEDITAVPIREGLFGAVMLPADGFTDLIEELLALWGGVDSIRPWDDLQGGKFRYNIS
jgi:hypothetical protein